ncbi:NAD(P)-dependent oxidoreductase [Cellulomonas composti]|uniref:Dehydrogenase n=1 Tax=Cellulomonas composti TaxID=266130 RepID=A0A511J9L9_9CELL|nr:NAD(P)-dependent oxidoreductase [Cellulomonas composti]GEL94684.1 dehydrogenase [Cellulomonas composti]
MEQADETLTVTVLGTGIMGAAMARNLARAGLHVVAWNRTRATAEPLAADGVTVADSPAAAVREAEVVVTMLHDGAAVLETMRSASGGLRAGTVWLQSTTVGLDALEPIATFAREHGLVLVDAPVLGTRQPAESGTLTVLAAGPAQVRDFVGPVLAAVGSRTVWTGEDAEAGTATRLKLVANSWVLAVNNAVGETVALAASLGVAPATFLETVAGGPLDMGYLRAKAALIVEDRLSPPSFAATTAAKDAHLIVAAGAAHGVRLDGLEAAAARLDRVAAEHGREDMAAAFHASRDTD